MQEIYRFPYGSPCYNADVNPQFRSHTFPVIHIPRKPVDQDIIDFVEHRFGFYPDLQQRLLLTSAAKRVILNCTRQWGKTTVSAAKAVHRAFTVPNSLIVVASPGFRQSGEWMRRAADLLRRLDIPPCGDGCNRISLLLPNGSRIVGLPEAEAKVRGFSALSMLVIDEAARVSDEMYYKALRPMLSVGSGDIWMMSTPFGRRGFFYETWANDDPEWLKVRVQATDCPRISPGFLAEQRSVMTSNAFRQEHMCEFIGSGDALFDRDLVESAFDNDLQPV